MSALLDVMGDAHTKSAGRQQEPEQVGWVQESLWAFFSSRCRSASGHVMPLDLPINVSIVHNPAGFGQRQALAGNEAPQGLCQATGEAFARLGEGQLWHQ